ncbi:MAG: type II toxin-antitoxin system PemK/MazF family toxin [Nitrospirae bacterium]|nr:type II toxin-antitoxin system PemK/MazF family toxin [Nitrospirota bacterium]
MTRYKKGTVVLVLFPNSDLITAKLRPALVVQSEDLNTGFNQVIVAMITSNLNREGHQSRFRINKDSDEGRAAGVLTDSIVMTDNLATVKHNEINRTIGCLYSLKTVDKALKATFGLK